ncbi:hypothetical protein CMO88_00105 [Candidatus Woesearchaeota archaeon]|nr:hypothetical protein [Candidatus Woesearchaeota archaeon]
MLWAFSKLFKFTDKTYKSALKAAIVAGSLSVLAVFLIIWTISSLVLPPDFDGSFFSGGVVVILYSILPILISLIAIHFGTLKFFYHEKIGKLIGVTIVWILSSAILSNIVNFIASFILMFIPLYMEFFRLER